MTDTPPATAADLMRLIDRYAGHLAQAEGLSVAGSDRSMERETSRAAELRTRIRAEVDRLYAGQPAPVDDDPRHIIDLRADGWTIKHPLSCRLGDLFGCPVNLAAEGLDGPPAPPGRYAVSVDSIDGQLRIGDRVDQAVAGR
ncbi:DUF6085 family protein [Micromonospora sp. NPDC048999]|uniref:DUF6085 family protein n=1 Tax=Micromonospora sp. NPDC048999 TaxID=3155391 RepID=UPI0033E967C4